MQDQDQAEPRVVTIAEDVWAGCRKPDEFHAAFATARVYAKRTERPGVWVTEVPGRGRWTVVFSLLSRLAAHAGECEYLSTTGADFLELVPSGVGVMFDPDDRHRFPVLARVASPQAVAKAWERVIPQRARSRPSLTVEDIPLRIRLD